MEIKYEHTFQAPRETVWDYLQSEEVLAKTLPGCKKFDKVEEGVYYSELGLNVGPIKGVFTGKVNLTELNEPESYRLGLQGKGKPGELNADALIELNETEEGTLLVCTADSQVTGIMASVGQRVMGGVAKMILGQFFKGVASEIEKTS